MCGNIVAIEKFGNRSRANSVGDALQYQILVGAAIAEHHSLAIWKRLRDQPGRVSVKTIDKRAQRVSNADGSAGLIEGSGRAHAVNGPVNRPAQFIVRVGDGVVWERTI